MLSEEFQDSFISICHVLQVEIMPAPGMVHLVWEAKIYK